MTLTTKETMTCDLCDAALLKTYFTSDNENFCCEGCRAVYQILHSKGELEGFQDHPLFLQAVQSGLIANRTLIDSLSKKKIDVPEEEFQTFYFEIGDMWCPSCAEVIRLILMQEKGVRRVVIDYATDIAVIEFTPRYSSKEQIFKRVGQLGYKPSELDDGGRKEVSRLLWFRFGIGAFFTLNIMMLSYPLYASYFYETSYSLLFAWLSALASLPVLFFSGWPLITRFVRALSVGVIGMEALVVMGVGAASLLSWANLLNGSDHVYFDSMSAIIVLMLLGKIIESRAKFNVKDCLLRLVRMQPRRCRVKTEDGEEFLLIKEIQKGRVIVVCAGEKIPLDARVVCGEGAVDESMMTGESVPVIKSEGDRLLAGTVLSQGVLEAEVTSTVEATALSHIIRIVEGDLSHKTVYTRAADHVVQWFVPVVLIIALMTLALHSLLAAVSVLLISCPCALGIAAPLAEARLLHRLASKGAIVRNRGCLKLVGNEDVIIFDKTGTVTEGKFRLQQGLEALTKEELGILKGLTARSNHPISVALNQSIDCEATVLDSVREVAGQGIEGWYKGKNFKLGSPTFVGIQKGENNAVYFNHLPLKIYDRIREGVNELLNCLKTPTMLLSGDAMGNVEAVAKQCGFTTFKGGCSPLEKREVVRNYPGITCMIGDGINDAPALTAADIGISVLNASDISIQVSDILLLSDDLFLIPKIRDLARQGRKILFQNIFWAFFYNSIGVALAAFGLLSPLFAAAAMVLSSIFVIYNSSRL